MNSMISQILRFQSGVLFLFLSIVAQPAFAQTTEPDQSLQSDEPRMYPVSEHLVIHMERHRFIHQQSLLVSQRGSRLVKSGWATLLLAYFSPTVANLASMVSIRGGGPYLTSSTIQGVFFLARGLPYLIPFAGPIIASSIWAAEFGGDQEELFLYFIDWFSAISQVAGLLMIIYGYKLQRMARELRERTSISNFAIVPAGPANGPGLSIAAVF